MIILFWVLTAVLLILAFGFVIPWLKGTPLQFGIYGIIAVCSYALYFSLGSSHLLKNYYTETKVKDREQVARIQPLFMELKRQEYRLRQHLEAFPGDDQSHSQLLELLAIQALQQGNRLLAKHYLESALLKLPNVVDGVPESDRERQLARKKHLEGLLDSL